MLDPLIPFITCIKIANNTTGVLASSWNCSAGSFLELCCIYLFCSENGGSFKVQLNCHSFLELICTLLVKRLIVVHLDIHRGAFCFEIQRTSSYADDCVRKKKKNGIIRAYDRG